MAQSTQISKPTKLNLDAGRKYLPPDASFYLLNNDSKNKNALGKNTPMPANYPACEMELGAGENYNCGRHYSAVTNEAYAWTYNSNNIHFISRINGNGVCEIVYDKEYLHLSADPKHEICQDRAILIVEKSGCVNRHGKYLMWCDGYNESIGFLDVDASIATNGFTTSFFDRCNINPADFINLCVPQPCGCLQAEFIPLPDEQVGWTNHLVDIGIKLMYKWEYYDGRMSEWSDRSTLYFQNTKGCFDSSTGFSRCMTMRVPVGNPMVTRIHIAFNKSEFDEANNEIWYESEVIEKYKKYNSTSQYWYERELAELKNYSDDDCSFDYEFCNDKQCKVIDPVEVTRVYNPMPRYAQGLIQIKDAVGAYNYILGNCPIDKGEADKFKISINCPEITECENKIVTVTVRAIIYNDVYHRNQFVYRTGGTSATLPDDENEIAYFGGVSNVSPTFDLQTGFGQQFSGTTRNFIPFVEGMDVWGEMEQWSADEFYANPHKVGVLSGMDEVSIRSGLMAAIKNGAFYYQQVKLKMRKGTRGFIKLTSHKSESGDDSTSTFVTGVVDIRTYAGYEHLSITNTKEEIYFDTCDGDVELFDAFIIKDNAITNTIAFYGYVKDADGRPVEGAIIVPYPDGAESVADQGVTDHNGFYHIKTTSASSTSMDLQVRVETGCSSFATIQTDTVEGVVGANTEHNITIESESWADDFYSTVEQQVNDCNGNGVGGIRVALSGSKYDVTDATGLATFRIRNYSTRDRDVRSVVMDYRGCFNIDCVSACNPCMPTSTASTPDCYIKKETITLDTAVINVAAALKDNKGLKAGGLYPFAFVVQGACGNKISAAYELPALRIPKTQEKGHLSFCEFSYNAEGMQLPFDGCLKIVRGENLNPYELQWIVDRIEHVADNKLRLTIQSLNDYNSSHFFKTNTIYQFLKGDRVEFISNGDGSIFTTSKHGLLNYLLINPIHDEEISGEEDAPADFFNQILIEDDGRLDDLEAGAIIELQRSKTCQTEPTYREICASIPIVNGQLVYETGTFTTFDTFFVNRVLTYEGEDDRTVVLPTITFEHHSPSDFWGDHLSDGGKVHFANKFETEKRFGRNISINSATRYNFFGDLVKKFDDPSQGGYSFYEH